MSYFEVCTSKFKLSKKSCEEDRCCRGGNRQEYMEATIMPGTSTTAVSAAPHQHSATMASRLVACRTNKPTLALNHQGILLLLLAPPSHQRRHRAPPALPPRPLLLPQVRQEVHAAAVHFVPVVPFPFPFPVSLSPRALLWMKRSEIRGRGRQRTRFVDTASALF